MYTRAYKASVAIPPLLWVTVFLLVPYAILFCYSFWSVSAFQAIVHNWNLQNYLQLMRNPIYLSVLFRSMRIAGAVTVLALLLGIRWLTTSLFTLPSAKTFSTNLSSFRSGQATSCAATRGKQFWEARASLTVFFNTCTSLIIRWSSFSIARSRWSSL